MSKRDVKAWRWVEVFLFVIGAAMLTLYGASHLYTNTASRIALVKFKNSSAPSPCRISPPQTLPEAKKRLDFSLWSEKRIRAYREALSMNFDPPLAVLYIPKLRLEVPVFDGMGELILDRGVGRITGTGRLGESGNIGIAGHRDGFFRGLKELQLGDRVELMTHNQKITYLVDDIVVVSPYDLDVLKPRRRPSLSLVTCYPFYFVGAAPQRYIVHAYETAVGENLDKAGHQGPKT